jgi:hypothetical protein
MLGETQNNNFYSIIFRKRECIRIFDYFPIFEALLLLYIRLRPLDGERP